MSTLVRNRSVAADSGTDRYVLAAGRAILTRFYDPIMALTMREGTFRPRLEESVLSDLRPGGIVADVGCGTGIFAVSLARSAGTGQVVGVDGDPEVLELAKAKPGADRVRWEVGLADHLPFTGGSVDRVVLSLLLHHLGTDGKRRALREAMRVLRPGGRLHVADWGRPVGLIPRAGFGALRLLDGFENTREHATGRLQELILEAGSAESTHETRLSTVWGTLDLIRAEAPSQIR